MLGPKSHYLQVIASAGLLTAALAAPAAAQQSGRMQVHATVVDVSASLDVLAALKESLHRPGGAVRADSLMQRPVLLVSERRPAAVTDEPLRRERMVTIFYF